MARREREHGSSSPSGSRFVAPREGGSVATFLFYLMSVQESAIGFQFFMIADS